MTSKICSSCGNDISRSIWVNSGWRSARRSSSRKQRTIWKYLSKPLDHQHLLEDLRRLRQRIKRARLHAAGHQVIARALRGGARHERRLDFQEALASQSFADREGDLRAQDDVALHVRAAQVDVAVFEPGVFGHIRAALHRKRRGTRLIQYPDLFGDQLHFAGFKIGIYGIRHCAARRRLPRR